MTDILFNLSFQNLQGILLALIPALLNFLIFFYIIFRLPENVLSYSFAVFVLALAIWQTGDVMARMSNTAGTALLWLRILSIGPLLISPAGMHFTLLFTERNKLAGSFIVLLLIYFPAVVFESLICAGFTTVPLIYTPVWGWTNLVVTNLVIILEGLWVAGLAIIIFTLLLIHAVKTRNNAEKSIPALLIAIGFAIPTIQGTVTQVVFPNFLHIPAIPVASTFMSAFSVAVIIALTRNKHFLIPLSIAARVVLKTISDILFIVTPQGRLTFMNHAGAKKIGIDPGKIENYSLWDLFPVNDSGFKKFNSTVWPSVLKDKHIEGVACNLLTAGGREIPVLISATTVEVQNKIQGVLFLAHDITERKRQENALKTQTDQLVEAQRLAHIGSWEWDVRADKIIWSDELYRIYGLTPQEFEANYENFLKYIHPDDRKYVNGIVQKAYKDHQPFDFFHRIIRPDGTEHILNGRGSVLTDGEGNTIKMSGTSQDVTKMKITEAELKQKSEELTRSNKELEQFAYASSHDLQEPLRTIISYLQLLEQRYKNKLDAEADEFIHFAVDGASRMHALINDLLMFSRVGTRAFSFEKTDFSIILENVMDNLRFSIEENNTTVIMDNEIPVITADPLQMTQLFQNLISNAIKFKREQPVKITIAAKEVKSHWLFSVSDNGIGIDKQYREKIFLIFQRLHSREEFPGTGIGLAICRKIVERHGGKIWVESKLGEGSVFYFTIAKENVKPSII